MKHGSLFSGIGGFDLASEWMGWENVFHCEWMEFPRKVLDYYWPNADSHIDICKTDFKKYANKIDILTGGFPCQPFSMAGKRKGTEDERYLWGEMLRAIQEIKPKFVIAENVFGITNIDGGLVFEQVCLDLEAQGYKVQPFIIPAAAKNAPHRRDRVWFIAYTNGTRKEYNARTNNTKTKEVWREKEGNVFREFCSDGITTNSKSNRRDKSRKRINEWEKYKQEGNSVWGKPTSISSSRTIANSKNFRSKNALENGQMEGRRFRFRNKSHTWNSFPLESPICGGDDGLPSELDGITFSKWRAESIKGYGNAIVPQVAFEIFKQLEKL
jgi:DNA (cytosine-5)-methyltransferase 1